MTLARVREVFHEVAGQPAEMRARVLEAACGGDAALRMRVEELLAAEAEAGAFLSDPTLGGLVGRSDRGDAGELPQVAPRFTILEKIGEGGYGDVYLAEQTDPVRRKVAIKLLKAGMDSRQIVARFESERRTLAVMDHPHIARVFDAGTTPTGRPFFVMEWVQGVPIVEFCRLDKLSPHDRLRLFTDVCRAVQHAHAKGVIHRDLKPTNILVTRTDGRPSPKVIDFGIAKALHGTDEATLHTELRMLVGTPPYMSPEQAALSGSAVDTRSDVYSLGVILYEMLTGVTPFEAARLRSVTLAEMQRCLAEELPPKPSTRVQTLAQGRTAASLPENVPPFPAPPALLKGDLDWIVMKALEKVPARRYATAAAMADDVARHLAHEPVSVGPPSPWYALGKFARRHRTAMSAACVAVLALCGGLWMALYGLSRARRESAAKEVERRRAETVVSVLNRALASANPLTAKGGNYTLHRLLDDFTRDFDASTPLEPEVEVSLRQTLGRAYQSLAEYADAERQFTAGLALAENFSLPELAALRMDLGWLKHDEGRYEAAQDMLARALATPALDEGERSLAEVRLAAVWQRLGKREQALADVRKAVAHRTDEGIRLAVRQQAASVFLACEALEEAASCSREALRLAESQASVESPRTVEPLLALADVLGRQGRRGQAEAHVTTALQRAERALGADHPITLMARTRLADFRAPTSADHGASAHREVHQALVAKLGADHPDTMEELIKLCLSTAAAARPGTAGQPTNSSTRLSEISGTSMTDLIATLKKNDRLGEFEVVVRRGYEDAALRPDGGRIALELESVYLFIRLVGGHVDEAHEGFGRLIAKAQRTMEKGENFLVALHILRAMASELHWRPDVQASLDGLVETLDTRPPGDFQTLRYLHQIRQLCERNFDVAGELKVVDVGLKGLPPSGPLPPEYRTKALLGRARLLAGQGAVEAALDDLRHACATADAAGGTPGELLLTAARQRAELEAATDHWADSRGWLPALLDRLPGAAAGSAEALRSLWGKCQARLATGPTPGPSGLREPDFSALAAEAAALWPKGTPESRHALGQLARRYFAWRRGADWRGLTSRLEDARLGVAAGRPLVESEGLWNVCAVGDLPEAWPAPGGIDGGWHVLRGPFAAGLPVPHGGTMASKPGDAPATRLLFCRFFDAGRPEDGTKLKLSHCLAAGATVWLNGRELLRVDAPTDEANRWERSVLSESLVLPSAGIVLPGKNVLAIEVLLPAGTPPGWCVDVSLAGLP